MRKREMTEKKVVDFESSKEYKPPPADERHCLTTAEPLERVDVRVAAGSEKGRRPKKRLLTSRRR